MDPNQAACYLGLDVSTTACKAVVVRCSTEPDEKIQIVSRGAHLFAPLATSDTNPGRAEQACFGNRLCWKLLHSERSDEW